MKNKLNISYFLIANILALFLAKLVFQTFFIGIIVSSSFFIAVLIYSFIHSFFYSKLKEKVSISFLDLFPMVTYMIVLGYLENNYSELLGGILIIYLAPIFLIAAVSIFLQYLYKKFSKKSK